MAVETAIGVVLLAVIVAVIFLPQQMGKSHKEIICPYITEDRLEKLPRGWRSSLYRLDRYLDCSGTASNVDTSDGLKVVRAEKYLSGLDAPGMYFRVDIEKEDNEKVGFGVSSKSDYLEVEKLSDAGAVVRWNTEHAARAVKTKDRIIAINGIEGNGTMLADELRSATQLSMRVFRVSEDDRTAMKAEKADKEVRKLMKIAPPPGGGEGIPEPSGSKMVVLNANNAKEFIAKQPVVIVMFYAHWCGHCKQSAPDWTKAAELLAKDKLPVSARIAKFNCEDPTNQHLRMPDVYNFSSYPSMIGFKNGKLEFFVPDGGPDEIAASARALALGVDPEKEVDKALLRVRPMLYKQDTPSDVVYDLDVDNFDDIVLKEYEGNNAVWIVEFYSDKCPFCQSLKPEIVQASKELTKKFKGQVRVGAVNSRAFGDLAKRFGVTSYPWIISIYANKKIDDMAGLGGAQSVVDYATEHHSKVWRKEKVWSTLPILVPAVETDDNDKRGTKEAGMFSNSTGSWRELLGRRTWFFFHTLAAKYPAEPTEQDKEGVRHIVSGLGQHYPCPLCRLHLQKKLADPELGPVPVDNRQDLAMWFCKLHNMVNVDLNKPEQPCNAFQLDLMYLKSCGECSANAKDLPEEAKQGAAAWDVSKYFAGALPAPAKRLK